jgi:hypothetical protein
MLTIWSAPLARTAVDTATFNNRYNVLASGASTRRPASTITGLHVFFSLAFSRDTVPVITSPVIAETKFRRSIGTP